MKIIITCEHAVNTVPPQYSELFAPYSELLETHRAFDFGALALAKHLAACFDCDVIQPQATRLLIDCNRSISHPHCFSEISKTLPGLVKEQIINDYYLPYRRPVIAQVEDYLAAGFDVLHLSVHSFTPILNGIERDADIGFLYDPQRAAEKNIAMQWKSALKRQYPELKVRMNYPYKGISNGFTQFLRKHLTQKSYLGIEIEFNAKLLRDEKTLEHLKNAALCMLVKGL